MKDWDGPDCGIDGCAREVGHIGSHRRGTYSGFLDDMGKLLTVAMPRTDRERDELFAAEAEVRKLRSQLAVAEERQTLARQRYDRERTVLREMFDTWKSEVMSLSDGEGETPVREIPELPTATLTT